MDIFTLIEQDHTATRKMIEEIDLLPAVHAINRHILFKQLKDAITAHNDAEAGSFYIALNAHAATRDLAKAARESQKEIAHMLTELCESALTAAQWDQRFAAFQRTLLTHMDKEEMDIFPTARHVLSAAMASELGKAMEYLKHMKEDLLRKAG